MENYYDPDYYYHQAMTRVWVTMALNLSESTLLPYDPFEFANQISNNVEDICKDARKVSETKLKMKSEVENATSKRKKDTIIINIFQSLS